MGASSNDKKRSWTAVRAVEQAANKRTNDELYLFYKSTAVAGGYVGAGYMADYKHYCYKNSLL